jgi:ribosome-binding protein aMBF1 (putative translation factor)
MKRKGTTDAVEILHRRYFEGRPEALAILEEERANSDVAQIIRAARTGAGLSQRALAKLVGTTASVICQLEDADYEGHSLSMLRRIAAALRYRVEIRLVPASGAGATAAILPVFDKSQAPVKAGAAKANVAGLAVKRAKTKA